MLSPFGPTTPSDTITGDHYRRDFNLDVHVPQYAGLDDNERPTIDCKFLRVTVEIFPYSKSHSVS